MGDLRRGVRGDADPPAYCRNGNSLRRLVLARQRVERSPDRNSQRSAGVPGRVSESECELPAGPWPPSRCDHGHGTAGGALGRPRASGCVCSSWPGWHQAGDFQAHEACTAVWLCLAPRCWAWLLPPPAAGRRAGDVAWILHDLGSGSSKRDWRFSVSQTGGFVNSNIELWLAGAVLSRQWYVAVRLRTTALPTFC